MITIKKTLFTQWNFMRWFKLIIGFVVMFQAIQIHEYAFGIIGAFFFFQAVSGAGCCNVNNYNLSNSNRTGDINEVEFEEITLKK